jgi:subtilisin family serine protease
MKRLFVPRLLLLAALTAACAEDPSHPELLRHRTQMSEVDGVTDTYLVRFKKDIPANFSATVVSLGGEVIFAHSGAGIAAVAGLVPSGADQLAAVAGVAAVDADAYTTIEQPAAIEVEAADLDEPTSPAAPTLAAFYGRQLWNLNAIGAPAAFAAGLQGSTAVKVGVLDTGIDYLHPDLVGRVDMALSRSFLSATENARVPAGAHLVADLNYHGTHVASTIASNNWIGAGVTSNITLVGLKVCAPGTAANGFNGTCPTSGTLAAILYAADNDIPIINMSLGGSFTRRAASARGGDGPSFIATINSAFNYANRKGTVIVVSAGNSAINMDTDVNGYKSYCDAPHAVCVSATGPTAAGLFATSQFPRGVYLNIQNIDNLASYSNFGGRVMVAAPGGNAIPVWSACSGFTLHPSLAGCRSRFYNSPTSWSGSIVGLAGTSMASPHTAGVLALIASHVVSGGPQIKSVLTGTADDLGALGIDPVYGNGRINARRALGL